MKVVDTEDRVLKEQFMERFGYLVLVPIFVVDDDMGQSTKGEGKEMDAEAIWETITSQYGSLAISEELCITGANPTVSSVEDIKYFLEGCSGFSQTHSILTDVELAARKAEQRRLELEGWLSRFLMQYQINPKDVGATLDALDAELERLQSYREGMREDGLCIGYGVNSEQWHEEHSASTGDSDKVHQVIDWLAANAPLAYAKWNDGRGKENIGETE